MSASFIFDSFSFLCYVLSRMNTALPPNMRLHLGNEDREKKLVALAESGGHTIPKLTSELVKAALDAMPSDHITFPIRFQVLSPKKAAA